MYDRGSKSKTYTSPDGASFQEMGQQTGEEVAKQGPEVWQLVRQTLRAQMDAGEYDKWIKGLRFIADYNGSAVIVARTQFMFDRVHTDYKRYLQKIWKRFDPLERAIRLECWESAPAEITDFFDYPWPCDTSLAPASEDEAAAKTSLNPALQMRFETLVTGPSNAVAYKVARSIVTDAEAVPASVIVINGTQGVGKTHLLKSIEASLEARTKIKLAYISAEEFLVAYVEGAQNGDTRALKARVRNADIVLFDDLQNIAGKKGTNAELTGTIRTVSEGGGLVVLTADRAPSQMQGLSSGLMTVMKGAACIQIDLPDDEMRYQIVAERARALTEVSPRFVLDTMMCREIVQRVQGPGRDLCGAVLSLYTETGLGETTPDMETLDRVLSRQYKPVPITADMIKRAICQVFDMTRSDLEGARKFERFVHARQMGMYLLRELTGKSFPQIGQYFGKRHHTTALYAWRKIHKALPQNARLAAEITHVRQILRQFQAGSA